MKDLHFAILTIPSQSHRLWGLFSHLQTIGFPVLDVPHSGRWSIYQGYDYRDYLRDYVPESDIDQGKRGHDVVANAILSEMVKDGHMQYEPYLGKAYRFNNSVFYVLILWGYQNIMRKVAKSDVPVLVMENDAFFIDYSYDALCSDWADLVDTVGYENINVAMFLPDYDLEKYMSKKQDLSVVNDFWMKGACCHGQIANIYTPHGAQMVLEKPAFPIVETWLYASDGLGKRREKKNYISPPGVYSSSRGIMDLDAFYNCDSPHVRRDFGQWQLFFEGASL